ncbi:uncharacterized protein PV07_09268 [Cladophialophora immunda]|uniref:Uncharacterized protein n=1 Tax=Cladophialophora immunda TaxID=569365 RepID=A0A0D2C4P7_9EURO|nr:uncharacterized protein PV07_09268 [Cladophialophora immunda]KIW26148.1 hypothetical protein PV07_09268 [Cladophialophora immunda]
MGDVTATPENSGIPPESRTSEHPLPIDINQNISYDSRADSGYASASHSPKTLEKTSNPSRVASSDRTGIVLFPPSSGDSLREFDKPVDTATIARFKDVLERVEGPLLHQLTKRSLKREPMALRLMVLGHTEDTAKAWIVVLCHEARAKRARKFFEQQHVKAITQPQDSSIPSFEVLVVGQSPKTRGGAINVCISNIERPRSLDTTLCGAPMKLVKGVESRIGTCGGLVKLTSREGDYVLYGMTAGHLTDQVKGTYDLNLTVADDDSDSNSDSLISDDEDDNEDLSVPNNPLDKRDPLVLGQASGLIKSLLSETPSPKPELWDNIGQILDPPVSDFPQRPHYYDWALIDIDDRLNYSVNQLGDDHSHRSGDFTVGTINFMESPRTRPVVMKSGLQGIQSGVLSSLPCRVLLGHGREFVDAYTLKLDGDAEIGDGDSGSWVLHASRLEVYGHVVASDTFGAGYVIPMTRSLEDIRQTFGMASVKLPTLLDVLCKRYLLDSQSSVSADPLALFRTALNPSTSDSENEISSGDEQHGLTMPSLTHRAYMRFQRMSKMADSLPDSGYASHLHSGPTSRLSSYPYRPLPTRPTSMADSPRDSGYASLAPSLPPSSGSSPKRWEESILAPEFEEDKMKSEKPRPDR